MEEAKITQIEESEQKPQKQSMYQQGRFPSVVDTDDLVFELGKQVVDKINKEKLLESVLKKAKVLEVGAVEVKKLQVEAERKMTELKSSNKLYEENNRELDKELVSVRNELESQKREVVKVKSEFDSKNAENVKFNEALVKIRTELKNRNVESLRFEQSKKEAEERYEKLKEEISNLKDSSSKSKKVEKKF